LDKKIIATLLITLIAIVSTASLSYYVASQQNQTQNNPSPTPTPTPTQTPTLTPSPSETPTELVYIPIPSVPEFTVEFVDKSYDVPPVYGVDQYTGEEVVIRDGYHVIFKTIEVSIKNQPFNPYNDTNGNVIRVYYRIRIKGHFGGSWYYPDYSSYPQVDDTGERVNYIGAFPNSEYSLITYGLVGNTPGQGFFAGDQADFQVQAFIGSQTRVSDGPSQFGEAYHYVYTGETSGWSNTQTITVP
jgi:hypothetical protein